MNDIGHMQHALRLARRSLGMTAPNPAVGCVIVSPDGRIVGRGWTQAGGRPHAETAALKQAGTAARGATAFVTLEPCAHHGQTPPCAEALVAAGIARVVSAATDPDPRVSGRGHAVLRAGGIDVSEGVGQAEATALNQGFLQAVMQKRPLVTLKIAQSLDGKTATASGESKWITGEEARRFGHLLRARHDAILVGAETAIGDDPELTCRVPGLQERSPVRVVLDSRLRLSAGSKLAGSAQVTPVLVFTVSEGGLTLREQGVDVVRVASDPRGRPDIEAVLKELAGRGVTRLLVEGGATVHSSFLDRGFADRLEVFQAPMVLGAAGRGSIDPLAALTLAESPRFVRIARRELGPDILETFVAKA